MHRQTVQGGNLPAQMWRRFMERMQANGYDLGPFPPPPADLNAGDDFNPDLTTTPPTVATTAPPETTVTAPASTESVPETTEPPATTTPPTTEPPATTAPPTTAPPTTPPLTGAHGARPDVASPTSLTSGQGSSSSCG